MPESLVHALMPGGAMVSVTGPEHLDALVAADPDGFILMDADWRYLHLGAIESFPWMLWDDDGDKQIAVCARPADVAPDLEFTDDDLTPAMLEAMRARPERVPLVLTVGLVLEAGYEFTRTGKRPTCVIWLR